MRSMVSIPIGLRPRLAFFLRLEYSIYHEEIPELISVSPDYNHRQQMFQEPAVLALTEKYGKTPVQILLRFLTQKGIAVILRSTQPEHIKENFDLFDFSLTADEIAQPSCYSV